ncbi:MAG: hypothetical protein A3B99_04260 [Candidatus Yanofskybacteria bacterium RIFCSPHIGHO2_02_FULL_44_12b]|uniref:Methyltransferase domain-containing protein n=2 Tax=Candidatus Yanofskyibacteriota TaxID=1752733 RepID=A0A1F8GN31_9BACT|nr:MAG: hypothetical protein UW79_C0011G0020 [Candidatus Yanofskybacteria bacterium GW2011_GWA2_44_9]OGN04607.1 MAG: hypothetical protein A2659_00580 [Candidatus Yanofskybacteria bacterium RIFCSPHIGHO2_01_FULL_44_24]OGN15727.1 MAG: hypothetical protein A3B99_04260 [Candidatus Yanofskybacteria bacterium RIFCSPHIGHO2_02_FULL_44_12b]OGN26783.1 MAG: hypothetical protein A2925_04345 [Candidatus Yanofskybacteria bacterium RIFCSPLOWO2_01_FULL_44_22]
MNKSNQDQINATWRDAWVKERGVSGKKILGSRLSVESYKVVKKYIPADVGSILEIGTGSGRFAVRFAQDFPKARVVATDILEESLSEVRKLSSELGVGNVETKQEDIFGLSFSDGSFDVVFCDAVIQHLPEYESAVKEMVRAVKPGGLLIVSVVNFWNPHTFNKFLLGKKYEYGFEKSFTRRELRDIFKKYGLSIAGEDGFYPAYGIARLKRRYRIFGPISGIADKVVRLSDKVSNRFVSRYFGFEILIVGRKV